MNSLIAHVPACASARHRLLALAALSLSLAACSGLDPRKLERLDYGMEQRHIADLLEETPIPVMRFFAEDEAGREQDVLIELYEGCEPHPNYALVSIDGRLAAATMVSGAFFLDGQWWREAGHWNQRELVCPWSHHDLQDLVRDAAARRVELAWDRLEPIDSRHPTRGRYTAIGMATLLVIPLVIYVPYYLWTEAFCDDGFERAAAARSFLLTTPSGTTAEQVVAALGQPTADSPDSRYRVLTYQLPGWFTITIGFLDGRLLWADFGSWYEWTQPFMK